MSVMRFISVLILLIMCNLWTYAQTDNDWEVDLRPRYWQNPEGLFYVAQDIMTPDMTGLWKYYIENDDETLVLISKRYVYCDDSIEPRSTDHSDIEFKIYPNPAMTEVSLVSSEKITGISITDLNGRQILNKQYSEISFVSIDVSQLITGMFIITIQTKHSTYSKLLFID